LRNAAIIEEGEELRTTDQGMVKERLENLVNGRSVDGRKDYVNGRELA